MSGAPAAELRAFLAGAVPRHQATWGGDTGFPARLAWHRSLSSGGWAAPAWPVEHGGRGLGPVDRVACDVELGAVDVPLPAGVLGLQNVGPALMMFGDAEQRRSLPRILDGTEIWAQGFSEPGAGSDLAGLTTRADVLDDGLVLNGQKVWTSDGLEATHALVLARTDPDAPRHRGISALLVDLRTSGVERRPITQLTGADGFAELFFTDVHVPREAVLGGLHQGWEVTTRTLGHERTGVVNLALRLEQEVVAAARTRGSTDAVLRDELVRRWMEARSLGLLGHRVLAQLADGQAPDAEQAVIKVGWSLRTTALAETLMALQGPSALLDADPGSRRFLRSRSATIAGGTTEVLLTLLAERVLGLPREPSTAPPGAR